MTIVVVIIAARGKTQSRGGGRSAFIWFDNGQSRESKSAVQLLIETEARQLVKNREKNNLARKDTL